MSDADECRTGILTLHYGFNEGAILQAYALALLLRSVLGGRVEIVDQRYPAKQDAYGPPGSNERVQSLSNAIDDWLPLSADRHRRADSGPLIRELGAAYDRLVFGSDVLWGLKYKRRSRRSLRRWAFPKQVDPFFPAFPNVYWPSPIQPCEKVVFAASVGTLNLRDCPKRHRRLMREGLEGCRAIGVRDEKSQAFVSEIAPALADRTVLLADPTFSGVFRDAAKIGMVDEGVRALLEERGVDFDRPRCLVIAKDSLALSGILKWVSRRGCQLVCVTSENSVCDLELYDQGFHPLEWAAMFKCFDYCVTERMHGAIFSLLNGTPFVAIDLYRDQADEMGKMESLLRRFNLEGVLADVDQDDPAAIDRVCDNAFGSDWDWGAIQARVEAASEQQEAFLKALSPARSGA